MITIRTKIALFTFLVLAPALTVAQPHAFDHVEPGFWWVGMRNSALQILFHDTKNDLSHYQASVKYAGVSVKEVRSVENPHYLFLTLNISPSVKPGKVPVTFKDGKNSFEFLYELKSRSNESNRVLGFSAADVVYLIMPDRFANGDETLDSVSGMYESTHRNMPYGRHGGDLKGIADHLDYVAELGVTAIWLNPVLENNQRRSSYHGYAITDLYKVDRRFGTNEDYLRLISQCHQKSMKVIQDMVFNHIGNDHWLMHDLPEKTWIHQFPEFTRTNYNALLISDPYQAREETERMSDGWFDTTMPDLNQKNPLLANYLIQNTLWWIEYAGIDGIRMDTYPYPDKIFMSRWADEVLAAYPKFNIVGEVWMRNITAMAYWQKGMINKDGFKSGLPSLTDFPLYYAIPRALNETGSWNSGLTRLYDVLSQDFIYPSPNENLIFVDNHDVTRFYTSVGRDLKKFKMGMAFLLTTRGVPQLYYGTELLMEGDESSHADLRKDFPGGWKGDSLNAFTIEGRTRDQNEAHDFLKTLLNWRKQERVIHNGKLTHYPVHDNVYVYFRYDDRKIVMVVMNGNPGEKTIKAERFSGILGSAKNGMNVITHEETNLSNLKVDGQSVLILEIKK
jgi:neopullulanase